MQIIDYPKQRPVAPFFSSGPCAKRPGWSFSNLNTDSLGRSHRSKIGKSRLKQAIDLTRQVLEVPDDFHIGIVPASDTGAVEMALWNLLGPRPIDVLSWETFGKIWAQDILKELKLKEVSHFDAPYGQLPDLTQVNAKEHDLVFTWNGTTSGVRLPNADWIPQNRKGLTICDATSAAFAQYLDFQKLDVVTFSWQKALGGEAAHGVIILSPRALQRLQDYTPSWPIPKIFRLTNDGKVSEGIFEGETINTPSMMAVEDYIDTLTWAQSIGGVRTLMKRADDNSGIIHEWIEKTSWIENLSRRKEYASNTSVCLSIVDPDVVSLGNNAVATIGKGMVALLEKEKAAFDIGSYKDAPAGLRIWCGATVEASDIKALLPWLEWAFLTEKQKILNP